MADNGSGQTTNVILILVVVAALALIVWFVIGRGDQDSTIDVNVDIPTQQEGGSPP